ncbi:hypothetical protein [uncultured Marinobacter sp.]|uniref:hypothetical protein n=1 Tax=uncultured Marinobacter sp. TaxID=187379 RepID=UPI002594C566|nr:hypothetical protein [uncultured Marinobacter sp.]
MIEQIAIAVFGLTAIWLSQAPSEAHRKWAPVLGLMSQPFWFYATLAAEQYGIFVLTLFYTLAWCRGIKNHWFPKRGVHAMWEHLKKEFTSETQ